jgi:hypothetical protein
MFGHAASMHPTYLKRVEQGQISPGLDHLLRLARAFGCQSIEQLFGPLPSESMLGGSSGALEDAEAGGASSA